MKDSRAKDQFLLVSLAGGSPKTAIEDAAKIPACTLLRITCSLSWKVTVHPTAEGTQCHLNLVCCRSHLFCAYASSPCRSLQIFGMASPRIVCCSLVLLRGHEESWSAFFLQLRMTFLPDVFGSHNKWAKDPFAKTVPVKWCLRGGAANVFEFELGNPMGVSLECNERPAQPAFICLSNPQIGALRGHRASSGKRAMFIHSYSHSTHAHTLDKKWSFSGSVRNRIPYMQNQTRPSTKWDQHIYIYNYIYMGLWWPPAAT